jgi:hypothetical protein
MKIEPKLVSHKTQWRKTDHKDDFTAESSDLAYKRVDGLAVAVRENGVYTAVVPLLKDDSVLYETIGPFASLKETKRAVDAILHERGFIVWKEDIDG